MHNWIDKKQFVTALLVGIALFFVIKGLNKKFPEGSLKLI